MKKQSLSSALILALGLTLVASASSAATKNGSPIAKRRQASQAMSVATVEDTSKPAVEPSCMAAYRKLFAKGTINIRMIFGYKDARPARFVGDRHERIAFVQRILKPCEISTGQACGFERDEDNADLFKRTIDGPDGQPVLIRVIVANSSVGSDDASNREDAFQKWQSGYAERIFLGGIDKADVVFYNGHSRFGGGPDFESPRLTRDGSIEVGYYQGRRPGFQKIQEHLTNRKKVEGEGQLKLLGLFSCASTQHFSDAIAKESKAGIISSRALIYYADALENSLGALSALLAMSCEKDFRTSIRHGQPVVGSRLQGFF